MPPLYHAAMVHEPTRAQWNERFSSEAYVYGTAPNDYLRVCAARLEPNARVLCLGEGEGRNAVFLATLGHQVTMVDLSETGLEKAGRLAAARGVGVERVHADLALYTPPPGAFDAVVSVFCHLPEPVRRFAHAHAALALRPGGLWIQEAYTPRQLEFRTGGPPTEALLYTPEQLRGDLEASGASFEVDRCEEVTREVHEGTLHAGRSAVVQVLARRSV
jgi:cyclopropane fatty-acyl-phospholipid synthase-like methyltransferase